VKFGPSQSSVNMASGMESPLCASHVKKFGVECCWGGCMSDWCLWFQLGYTVVWLVYILRCMVLFLWI